jgi:hypothetical protein
MTVTRRQFLTLLAGVILYQTPPPDGVYVDHTLTVTTTERYDPLTRQPNGGRYRAFKRLNDALKETPTKGIIWVRAGTYAEREEINAAPRRQACFVVNKSVSLRAYPGERPILTYDLEKLPIIDLVDKGPILQIRADGEVLVEGITIIGTHSLGDNPTWDTDINLEIGMQKEGNVTVRRCRLVDGGHSGVKVSRVRGSVVIEQCMFENTGYTYRDHHIYVSDDTKGYPVIIRHNVMQTVSGYAVHCYTRPPNCEIYANVILDCVGGGILFGGPNNLILHNTVFNAAGYGSLVLYKEASLNAQIKNNALFRPDGGREILLDAAGGENEVSHNAYRNLVRVGLSQRGAFECLNCVELTKDRLPQFVGEKPTQWGELRIKPESPLIGRGVELKQEPHHWLLDPSRTDWPTPIYVAPKDGKTVIGAFAP